jgi:hypothetical protein
VEEVEEGVLGEMPLGEDAHSVIAQEDQSVVTGDQSPRSDKPIGEPLDSDAPAARKPGERVVVVVEVGLQVAPAKPQSDIQRMLVEGNPVARDPLLRG